MKYITNPFLNVLNLQGKASRKEFYIFFLFSLIMAIIVGFLKNPLNLSNLTIIIIRLIIWIPLVTLGFRRLNEAGILKWLFLIPIINVFIAAAPPKKVNDRT
ncbi:hypothetical protein AAT17_08910 [Nonlabens sp. MIC269]|uniref:DUF805 domain-containing protein n=1 Tax=Nonlabens sp. MIC269 TaxID=1476901 RepID=UPI000722C82D|nr:DUF805 domain-containing protein [Nonlabens sp. MIC269]ALM21338.1 hypothetical protein AAT17_08910 [Nonlabens sp. MIC269]